MELHLFRIPGLHGGTLYPNAWFTKDHTLGWARLPTTILDPFQDDWIPQTGATSTMGPEMVDFDGESSKAQPEGSGNVTDR